MAQRLPVHLTTALTNSKAQSTLGGRLAAEQLPPPAVSLHPKKTSSDAAGGALVQPTESLLRCPLQCESQVFWLSWLWAGGETEEKAGGDEEGAG